jgi:hypothetical protein
MKVSVLISVLNGEGFINQALSSIQNQTYKVDQVVVINDASSDNTSLLLDSWKKKLPIFLITNKTNLGLVDSLNIGLSYCNGDWIFRLDHDDWWAINHVERLLHLISNSPNASFVSSRAVFLNPNSANYQLSSILNSCKIYSSLMWDNPIVQSSTAGTYRTTAPSLAISTVSTSTTSNLDLKVISAYVNASVERTFAFYMKAASASWSGSITVKWKLNLCMTNTAGTNVFAIRGAASRGGAWGSPVYLTNIMGTVAGTNILTDASAAMTFGGTIAKDKMLHIQVYRVPGDAADEVFTLVARPSRRRRTVDGVPHAGHRQGGVDPGDVVERPVLQVERGRVLGDIGHLHHPLTIGPGEAQVAVAFAVERGEAAAQSEVDAQAGRHIGVGHLRGRLAEDVARHGAPSSPDRAFSARPRSLRWSAVMRR